VDELAASSPHERGDMRVPKRAIQSAGTAMIESTGRGVLDAPLEARHDIVGGGTPLPSCSDASLMACKLEDATPHAVFKPSRCSDTSRMTEERAIAGRGAR
jgi:hypothetical protein